MTSFIGDYYILIVRKKNCVQFVSQEDKIYKSNGRLVVPLCMRAQDVTPVLSGVHVDAALEGLVAVVERGHRGRQLVDERYQSGSYLLK